MALKHSKLQTSMRGEVRKKKKREEENRDPHKK